MGPLPRGQFFVAFKRGFGVLPIPSQGPQGGRLLHSAGHGSLGKWKRFAKFTGLVAEWASELRSA